MKTIDLIAGARPNFMKIAPIIRALQARPGALGFRLVHTGQHYDQTMSGSFFEQLGIPKPDVNLEVGSGTQAQQAGRIMIAYEELLQSEATDAVIVVGDVTSTMSAAIAAQKMGIPVGHVEGGIRSNDWSMPEEINRRVTDSISNWFFTTSAYANANLKNEGVDEDRIFFVGNTMIDSLLAHIDHLKQPTFWAEKSLAEKEYIVLTLHRPVNVDDGEKLHQMLSEIVRQCDQYQVIFPAHPRTAKSIPDASGFPGNLHIVSPLPYLEFNYLVKNSMAVITDSGGITEETTVLGVPCLTMRNNTERPETIAVGTNELVGSNPEGLEPFLEKLFRKQWKKGGIPEKWDGNAGKRIVSELESLLCP